MKKSFISPFPFLILSVVLTLQSCTKTNEAVTAQQLSSTSSDEETASSGIPQTIYVVTQPRSSADNDWRLTSIDYTTKSQNWIFAPHDSCFDASTAPLIVNSSVYLLNTKKLYSLNNTNGTIQWSSVLTNYFLGLYSSPVHHADNETVICNDQYQNLNAFTYDGTPVWTRYYGSSSSEGSPQIITAPCIYRNKIFVSRQDKRVLAVNASTGKIIWSVSLPESLGPFNEGAICTDGTRVFAASAKGKVYALSADDGHLLWSVAPGTFTQLAFLTTKYDKLFLNDGEVLHCLDVTTGSEVWHVDDLPPYSSATVYNNKVFVVKNNGSGGGALIALSVSTGSVLWQNTDYHGFQTPTFAAGSLFICDQNSSDQNVIYAINAASGVTTWTYTMPTVGYFPTESVVVKTTTGKIFYPVASGELN